MTLEVEATILQTDVALDKKEDDEDKMEDEDRGKGREEELQYYRTLAELPFGSPRLYMLTLCLFDNQFEIYFTQNHNCIHTY